MLAAAPKFKAPEKKIKPPEPTPAPKPAGGLGPASDKADASSRPAADVDDEGLGDQAKLDWGWNAGAESDRRPADSEGFAEPAGAEILSKRDPAPETAAAKTKTDAKARPSADDGRATGDSSGRRTESRSEAKERGASDLLGRAAQLETDGDHQEALVLYERVMQQKGFNPNGGCSPRLDQAVKGAIRCYRKTLKLGKARQLDKWRKQACVVK